MNLITEEASYAYPNNEKFRVAYRIAYTLFDSNELLIVRNQMIKIFSWNLQDI